MITINVSLTVSCEHSDVPSFIQTEEELHDSVKEAINYSLSRLDFEDVTFTNLTIEGYPENE